MRVMNDFIKQLSGLAPVSALAVPLAALHNPGALLTGNPQFLGRPSKSSSKNPEEDGLPLPEGRPRTLPTAGNPKSREA